MKINDLEKRCHFGGAFFAALRLIANILVPLPPFLVRLFQNRL